jgi:putative addiction module killer protein
MSFQIKELLLADGESPFAEWFGSLEAVAAAKVRVAVSRMEQGNLSNVEWFRGIGEFKIDWGPGLRVYLGKDGLKLIILIGGGSKNVNKKTLTTPCCSGKTTNAARHQADKDIDMALTREFKETVAARVQTDPAFAQALLDEAIHLFVNGDPESAKLILRDLVNSTVGFEALAEEIHKPAKSLHRMLSRSGNPTMSNISAVFAAIKRQLKVEIHTQVVMA